MRRFVSLGGSSPDAFLSLPRLMTKCESAGTSLSATVVPLWATSGGTKALIGRDDDPEVGPRLRKEIQNKLDTKDDGGQLVIVNFKNVRHGRERISRKLLGKRVGLRWRLWNTSFVMEEHRSSISR